MTTSPVLASAAARDGIVLVVDDVEKNLQVVGNLLADHRYEVMFATDGPTALDRVAARKPDLILLDLMMPGMDGIEVCRRLQQDPASQDIPVIFLTADHDDTTAVRGLEQGAVDFITKPFHGPELLARVATHVALKLARDDARRSIREKNDLMSAVAHDLKNPLTSVRLAASALLRQLADVEQREMADIIVSSCDDLVSLIEDRLSRNAREATAQELNRIHLDLGEVLAAVAQQNRFAAHEKQIELQLDLPPGAPLTVLADYHATGRIFDNLVSNAVKFSPPGQTIALSAHATPDTQEVQVRVQDHGPGFSPEDRDQLFQPYQRLSAQPTAGESSTGLGLSITHDLVTRLGGRIELSNTPGGGATFTVALPTPSR